MSKKKSPSGKHAKKTRRGKQRLPPIGSYVILSTFSIGSGNVISDPTPIVCPPGVPVVWIVQNDDSVAHDVMIDPAGFKRRSDNKKQHPFARHDILKDKIPPGQRGLLYGIVKGQAANDGYCYRVDSTNNDGTHASLDPDLDVVDPNSIVQM